MSEETSTATETDEVSVDPTRDETINVRVSEDEKARIVQRARERGLGASTYLRFLGLGIV
jgi:hypothetical protein